VISVLSIGELDARYYPNYVDEHVRFERTVRRYLRPEHVVLDAGAGQGARYPYDYRKWVRLVVGVDLEERVGDNTNLHAATIGDVAHLPFADGTFNMFFSKYLLEHLSEPVRAFREFRRVLRPGGRFVFHTPNRFHYVALAARLTPHRFHLWFNAKRGRLERDTFETLYRANSRLAIGRLAARAGFSVAELELFEPKPSYLFFHPLAYRAGIAYERLVSRAQSLRDLRCVIIGVLEASKR
jgi:SAM-dependent methyltransferase